jgi:hypothetical protein
MDLGKYFIQINLKIKSIYVNMITMFTNTNYTLEMNTNHIV